ncbi:ABC transporter substrate-binding protein [Arcanobacterium canis]|uniref:ABC transporter substrate-binding protein n=1 Tax=Arcanobacterium canis TaxID=999183 RepID=A0ABY8FYY1_9ACTO|nr:ABC transporter substrate-binding protein [Arcanobacterium canis]WFM82955.1 ABC transporter substrate-binding protein [Arcanobacterium canis]
MKKIFGTAAVALTLALTACGANATEGASSAPASSNSGATTAQPTDLSDLKKVDELAALVPDAVKADGKLTNGAELTYAPGEFYAPDGTTQLGYDIDLTRALATVLGLKPETQASKFDAIIPAIGTKYEVGLSAFNISPERQKVVNMVQYFQNGSRYSVAKGNPKNFDPANPCGAVVGVQTGTAQDEALEALNKDKCAAKPITIQKQDEQARVTLALAGGQIDAMYTDGSVADYAGKLTSGKTEIIGDLMDKAGMGVAVSKNDPKLTEAVQKAMQYLMDHGYVKKIFNNWGITEGVETTATLNPAK